ncbi:hypothetical protein BJ508DRAFT_333376 [Ascobolus immersus RN42]|uniref:Uncharacterized protein n=1 Tax=Ascobolus immersus RN42 TaxID=1160509 RepID=A0A3N4HWT8_ASCIM|nr:hypothetical protein BJ508DRAFT_333376 [Ascobolus immersus RN42]
MSAHDPVATENTIFLLDAARYTDKSLQLSTLEVNSKQYTTAKDLAVGKAERSVPKKLSCPGAVKPATTAAMDPVSPKQDPNDPDTTQFDMSSPATPARVAGPAETKVSEAATAPAEKAQAVSTDTSSAAEGGDGSGDTQLAEAKALTKPATSVKTEEEEVDDLCAKWKALDYYDQSAVYTLTGEMIGLLSHLVKANKEHRQRTSKLEESQPHLALRHLYNLAADQLAKEAGKKSWRSMIDEYGTVSKAMQVLNDLLPCESKTFRGKTLPGGRNVGAMILTVCASGEIRRMGNAVVHQASKAKVRAEIEAMKDVDQKEECDLVYQFVDGHISTNAWVAPHPLQFEATFSTPQQLHHDIRRFSSHLRFSAASLSDTQSAFRLAFPPMSTSSRKPITIAQSHFKPATRQTSPSPHFEASTNEPCHFLTGLHADLRRHSSTLATMIQLLPENIAVAGSSVRSWKNSKIQWGGRINTANIDSDAQVASTMPVASDKLKPVSRRTGNLPLLLLPKLTFACAHQDRPAPLHHLTRTHSLHNSSMRSRILDTQSRTCGLQLLHIDRKKRSILRPALKRKQGISGLLELEGRSNWWRPNDKWRTQ